MAQRPLHLRGTPVGPRARPIQPAVRAPRFSPARPRELFLTGTSRGPDALLVPVSRRSAAIWNIGFTYAAQILSLVRNIVLVPLFLEYIGKDEYYLWLVSGFPLTQLTNLDFGLTGVLLPLVASAYGNRHREGLERLLGSGLVAVFALALLVGAITAAISPLLPHFFDLPPATANRLTNCFLVVAFANAVQLVAFSASGLLRALQRPFAPGLVVVGSEVVALGATMLFVVRGWGLYAIVAGLVARCVVEAIGSGAMLWWVGRRHLRLRPVWDRSAARQLWRPSGYQFLAQIAGRIKTSLDAFLIGVIIGPQAGGGYALTVRAHEAVRTFTFGVSGSLAPGLAHLHGEDATQRFGEISQRIFQVEALIAAIGFGGVIALNPAFMQLWVGPGVLSSQAVSVVAALAGIVYLLSVAPYDSIYASGGFAILARVVWVEVILRFLLMTLLLHEIGVLGAPVASLTCQALALFAPLAWIAVRRFRITRGQALATFRSALELILISLTLATIFASAVPAASSWGAFVVQGALYVLLCLVGAWWLDRDLIRFVLRGGRAVGA